MSPQHHPLRRERVASRVDIVGDKPSPPESCRFTAMCTPADLEDGSDADWYVYDLLFRTSDEVGAGRESRGLAIIWTAREDNRVENESKRQERNDEST